VTLLSLSILQLGTDTKTKQGSMVAMKHHQLCCSTWAHLWACSSQCSMATPEISSASATTTPASNRSTPAAPSRARVFRKLE
jgi:hypothetical protein